MSIDLKTHGLRLRPIEWRREGDYRRVAYVDDVKLGSIEYVPMVEEWRINNGSPSDFYIDEIAAAMACERYLTAHIVALLEPTSAEAH